MTTFAQSERAALADLLADRGPHAPTLCAGWDTSDLAAHLLIRERNPPLAFGAVLPPLARFTDRAIARKARREPYPELVARLRAGPPRWSPMGWTASLDTAANAVEFFVHHEDVRRGEGSDAAPRTLDPAAEEFLWRRLGRMARLLMRKAPGGVTLRRQGGGDSIVVKRGSPLVVVTGVPSELALFAFGRQRAAVVSASGADDAITALREARLGF